MDTVVHKSVIILLMILLVGAGFWYVTIYSPQSRAKTRHDMKIQTEQFTPAPHNK